MPLQDYNEERLKLIYEKAVKIPNMNSVQKGCIKCPDCGEEILIIPTLRVMHRAIENHVCKHKEQLKADPIKEHQTAILIRLSLTGQVLQYACKQEIN